MVRAWIAGLVAVSLVGCTTLQPVAEISPRSLQPGDDIQVLTLDQRRLALELTAVDTDALKGIGADGQPLSVPLAQVVSVEKKVVAAGTTTLLVLGILGVAAAAVAAGGGGNDSSGSGSGEDGY